MGISHPRLVTEDSGEPDLGQKESNPDCQMQRHHNSILNKVTVNLIIATT